jgi:predicted porin
MRGGVTKAGWLSIFAIGGLALGSAAAHAADLGGDCCGDLEERVAELEATTARKGNRKVSLKISGWVNEQVLFWDDSHEKNAYVGNNDQERSRFKFSGEAKISDDWSAGYTLEIGVRDTKSSSYSQTTDEGGTGLDIRKSSWFIKSKTYGKMTVGRDGGATYHLLDDSDFTNTRYYADAESLATIGIGGFNVVTHGVNTGLTWGGATGSILARGNTDIPGNGERPDIVRYDTPVFKGFSASASWGEDDVWDTALIYEGEFHDFKVAGRIGYAEYTDGDGTAPGSAHCSIPGAAPGGAHCEEWGGSATIMHVPTGLFVYGAYGQKHDDDLAANLAAQGLTVLTNVDNEYKTWYLQAGLEEKWLPIGTTTIFGTYRHDDNGSVTGDTTLGSLAIPASVVGSAEVNTWGGGIVQNIAPAAMDVYLIYSNVDGSFDTIQKSNGAIRSFDIDTFQLFQAGARIQF